MNWTVEFLDEAKQDMKRLDHSVTPQILKGIRKVAQNPVFVYEGGYGKPLGNRNGSDLTGLYKIKFLDLGIRVVYRLVVTDTVMQIVVASARTDGQVYKEAVAAVQKTVCEHAASSSCISTTYIAGG